MRDLELGMLIVGGVSIVAAGVVVSTTARELVRKAPHDARSKALLAATQAGLLTPLWLLTWSYVYAWADFTKSVYVAIGLLAFASSAALLLKWPRTVASGRKP